MEKYKHDEITADFGYIWCSSCNGDWEGPALPENSPCTKVAQAIRNVTGYYEYLRDYKSQEYASAYLAYARFTTPLAFTPEGNLLSIYWNEDGSTL